MKSSKKGFTVKELLVSLAIVSVTTAWGLSYLVETIPNYRLNGAARSLVVQIHKTKLRAVEQRTIQYLDFDINNSGKLESEGCVLWQDRNGNRRPELLERDQKVFDFQAFPGVHLRSYPMHSGGPERGPNNTKIEAGGGDGVSFSQNRIKLNPNGTCSTGTIYLHNSKGRTFAIRLRHNCLTQLWRHYGGSWERW
jgi:hypothetical protein